MSASEALLQAIAVTAELTGTQLSAPAARVMADDLSRYPEHQVLGALTRCRKELRSRLTIADVVTRLDDGRPGPEEAWAMIPMGEGATVVWTEEMAGAFGVVASLIENGENVPARMAFLEHYRNAVQRSRDDGLPVTWRASLGHDPAGREGPLIDAVKRGRLALHYVRGLLPNRDINLDVLQLVTRPELMA